MAPPLLGRARGVSSKGADALVSLTQSCYPFSAVLFTSTITTSTPGSFDALHSKLHIRRATQHALTADAPGVDRLVARRQIALRTASSGGGRTWWAALYAADGTAPAAQGERDVLSPPTTVDESIRCCPDAVLLIDGVEVVDVARVVAPTLVEAVTTIGATRSTVGAVSSTHRADRRPPSYCRRRVNWGDIWAAKRCALRGADLLELSLSVSDADEVRERVLVAVANPGTTLADLHRQAYATRRGPLRSSFGFSFPCVRAALPASVIYAVRVLRLWQQRVDASELCTSVFWVSALGHLLDADMRDTASVLANHAHECVRRARDLGLTEEQASFLSALRERGSSGGPTTGAATLAGDAVQALLTYLLTTAVLAQAREASLELWNGSNYFLPAEVFASTTDAAAAVRHRPATPLSFSVFTELYRVSWCEEQ
ncbi:hypothetical protein NESM_000244800 [Novymonas esmeraldas]|uniref:Uncharacterized protein n=1 Tax=Novymonas esmeraldas TaxID=1808958 RepID=A0AAW0F8F9_9TRYP